MYYSFYGSFWSLSINFLMFRMWDHEGHVKAFSSVSVVHCGFDAILWGLPCCRTSAFSSIAFFFFFMDSDLCLQNLLIFNQNQFFLCNTDNILPVPSSVYGGCFQNVSVTITSFFKNEEKTIDFFVCFNILFYFCICSFELCLTHKCHFCLAGIAYCWGSVCLVSFLNDLEQDTALTVLMTNLSWLICETVKRI